MLMLMETTLTLLRRSGTLMNLPNHFLVVCFLGNVQRSLALIVSDSFVDIDLVKEILDYSSVPSGCRNSKCVIT